MLNCYFQFHKGAIETGRANKQIAIFDPFNSIKVRLKHAVAVAETQNSFFQFHKGAIETKGGFA